MKKLFVIFSFLLSLCLVTLVFNSCKKDKNTDNPTGGDGTSGLVSRIVDEDGYWLNYLYDSQNRLTSIIKEDGENLTFSYPFSNTIIIDRGVDVLTLTLNSDGYIIKLETDWNLITYEYDNGYLVKETEDDGTFYNYLWENGNLKSVTDNQGTTTFSYGTTPYKESNIAIWSPPMNDWFFELPVTIFGKRSKNLATSVTHDGKTRDIRYEINPNGYVTKVYNNPWGSTDGLWLEVKYK